MLLTLKDQFLGRDLDGMMSLAQKEGPKFFARDPDLLINKAYAPGIKISATKMAKWRKEFESARKKELAEEGEIRWLRAENRNLNNRILSLEKENNTLAHNLIQRSVKVCFRVVLFVDINHSKLSKQKKKYCSVKS